MTKQEQIAAFERTKERCISQARWKDAEACDSQIALIEVISSAFRAPALPIEKEVGQ
jgi:hypothetical protein